MALRHLVALCLSLLLPLLVTGEDMILQFPEQFFVSTGTTIPFKEVDPVAQSGNIYFDVPNSRMRIDNYWLGMTRSFIADMSKRKGYVINDGVCNTVALTGRLLRAGIPMSFMRDPELNVVRGVPVRHYAGMQSGDTLQHVDYFVKQLNITALNEEGGEDVVATVTFPWRVLSRRTARKEISPPPADMPNWRFFGEPMMDELVAYDEPSKALERFSADVEVTVDFYNFVPIAPDPSLFTPPATCEDDTSDQSPNFAYDVDLMTAQRLLVDLSFNSAQGIRLMDRLFRAPEQESTEEL